MTSDQRRRHLRVAQQPPPADTGGFPTDPLNYEDQPFVNVNLNNPNAGVPEYDLRSAITFHDIARDHAPRRWSDITNSSDDQHACAAMVTALSNIETAAQESTWHWILAARQAGVTWQDIAHAAGDVDIDSLRAAIIDHVAFTDWDTEDTRQRLQQLTADDPHD